MSGWKHDRRSRHERGYGSKWVKLRDAVMQRDGNLCQPCARKGRPTPAREVDHIIPKAKGGTDEMANLQAICKACHDVKSKSERAEANGHKPRRLIGPDGWPVEDQVRRFGYSIPDGVKHSAIPVVLVCGPPAAGKTTYIANNSKTGDVIIDFDQYLKKIGGIKWDKDKAKVRQAFALRDAEIHSLQYRKSGTAWMIAMAPTAKERKAWGDALGPSMSVVMMDTPEAECIARVKADPTRGHAVDDMARVIRQWWADYT